MADLTPNAVISTNEVPIHTRSLPSGVWTNILEQYILSDSSFKDILQLRCVNTWTDNEILRLLFIVRIKNLVYQTSGKAYGPSGNKVPPRFALLHLQGFFSKRKLGKEYKSIRRTMLRWAGINYKASDGMTNTCFQYRPNQICSAMIVGSSAGNSCKIHDLLGANLAAFGPNVFTFGVSMALETTKNMTDSRYWSLLVACYQASTSAQPGQTLQKIKDLLQDFVADTALDRAAVSCAVGDCFLIAARYNNAKLIQLLHEEVSDDDQNLSKLYGRYYFSNALAESITLGHCESVEMLMKWKWKFESSGDNSVLFMLKLAIQQTNNLETREKMVRLILKWSETWRNIREMKDLLMFIGSKGETQVLEIVIDELKRQHFFRHERGNEGSFSTREPLSSLVEQTNDPQIAKMFLENRPLLLPHTTEEEELAMRRTAIENEMSEASGPFRRDLFGILLEHSNDLMESKWQLQNTLVYNVQKNVDHWSELAEKLGLNDVWVDHEPHTLGSGMLAKAVSGLHVEAVEFLVGKGIKLKEEAETNEAIYDDDVEKMIKLSLVRRILEKGGQGGFRERRKIMTTFTTDKPQPWQIIDNYVAPKHKPSVRMSTKSLPVDEEDITQGMRRIFRKGFSITGRRATTRKAKKHVSSTSISSGSEKAETGSRTITSAA